MINFINILKIAYKCRKKKIKLNSIYLPFDLLFFFYKKGIIDSWIIENSSINIVLRYINNKPIFNNIKIISTSGHRIYIKKKKNLKYYKDNIEIILLTYRGLMTLKEAEILGIGGEIFLIIYY